MSHKRIILPNCFTLSLVLNYASEEYFDDLMALRDFIAYFLMEIIDELDGVHSPVELQHR